MPINVGHAQFGGETGRHHAGIVDEHVEGAEAGLRLGHGGFPGGGVGYVEGQNEAAGGVPGGGGGLQGGQVVVGGHHLPAAPIKRLGQVAPDALGAAGQENGLGWLHRRWLGQGQHEAGKQTENETEKKRPKQAPRKGRQATHAGH